MQVSKPEPGLMPPHLQQTKGAYEEADSLECTGHRVHKGHGGAYVYYQNGYTFCRLNSG